MSFLGNGHFLDVFFFGSQEDTHLHVGATWEFADSFGGWKAFHPFPGASNVGSVVCLGSVASRGSQEARSPCRESTPLTAAPRGVVRFE